MNEEMRGEVGRKTISEARDRTQSKMLVEAIGALLMALSLGTFRYTLRFGGHFPAFALSVFGVSVAFVLVVRALRAATPGGAACGGMICLLVTFWTGIETRSIVRSGLTPLVLLFLLTFLATRVGRKPKTNAGLAEARHGRNAAQVIANLSVAGICTWVFGEWLLKGDTSRILMAAPAWMMKIMVLATLVEATADTVSSEIGQAFGGKPVLLTSLRRVAVGTDGAITVLGSFAGVAGGIVVAVAGGWAMHLTLRAAGVALIAGILGLFFDSLAGATLERRGWLGNDLVNFVSTAFAAGAAGMGYRFLHF
jgi:uncharacterized protein (TIGR00297 family)